MSALTSGIHMWSPLLLGVVHAGYNVRLASDFPENDIGNGEWNGETGHALMGGSGAVIAIQAISIIFWLNWMLKEREGKIKTQGNDPDFASGMGKFWILMLIFYILSMSLAVIDVIIVMDFDGDKAKVVDDKLKGTLGEHVYGLAAGVLGVAGALVIYHKYLTYGVRSKKKKYNFIEVHDS